MNFAFLFFVKIQAFIPAKIFFNWKRFYENKEKQGMDIPKGTMLVSNHKSLWDMMLYMMMFFKTPIRFLIADVVYDTNIGFVGWLMDRFHSIRVDRATMDFSFIEESVKALRQGQRVGVFPEGQLPRDGKMSRFTPSYVMIALQSGADIIPVYTDGTYNILKRTHVMIGERINLRDYCRSENPTREEIQACNELVLNKIIELGEIVEKAKAQQK